MPRYRLLIEYDGTPFVGWQHQANGRAVQEAIAEAVEKFAGERVSVNGAGRTDAGVHARGQAAHVDLAKDWDTDTVRDATNQHLKPEPVAILSVEQVADDFDARFSARQRRYLYRIANRRAPLTLDAMRAWRVPVMLDEMAMHEAAQALVGQHDFTTFRSSECQAKSPVKTLEALTVFREGEEVHVRAAARSFMHNQVRSMVGTLKLVGEGKWTTSDVEKALAAGDRAACGPVAPPHGLYLEAVEY